MQCAAHTESGWPTWNSASAGAASPPSCWCRGPNCGIIRVPRGEALGSSPCLHSAVVRASVSSPAKRTRGSADHGDPAQLLHQHPGALEAVPVACCPGQASVHHCTRDCGRQWTARGWRCAAGGAFRDMRRERKVPEAVAHTGRAGRGTAVEVTPAVTERARLSPALTALPTQSTETAPAPGKS